MGLVITRIVGEAETLLHRKIGFLTGGSYARITHVETLIGSDGVAVTNVYVTHYEDKIERDRSPRISIIPAFKQETKVAVENPEDVTNPNFQITVAEARLIAGYEAAVATDIITIPEADRPVIPLPTKFTLSGDGKSRADIYTDANFRSQFTDLGVALEDIDPDE